MRQILVYGDSMSWGIIPNTRERLAFAKRWPGVLETQLRRRGVDVRVIENCLNGRRTAWSDPFKPGRNGAQSLAQVIEMNSPLALAIIALGTNDFQDTHDNRAWASAQGVAKLIEEIRKAPIEPTMSYPEVMVVVPPQIKDPKGPLADKFQGAAQRCLGLAEALRGVAEIHSTHFFDMNDVTPASLVDGIHLDEDQHKIVGEAITRVVSQILEP